MNSKPRCKKFGRVLRNPVSIARGMGPVCAGDAGRSGRRPQVHVRRSSGQVYDAIGSGSLQSPLPVQVPLKRDVPPPAKRGYRNSQNGTASA